MSRAVVYALINPLTFGWNGNVVSMVTDDPEVAETFRQIHGAGWVEELEVNRATELVDARGRFFKAARRINSDVIK